MFQWDKMMMKVFLAVFCLLGCSVAFSPGSNPASISRFSPGSNLMSISRMGAARRKCSLAMQALPPGWQKLQDQASGSDYFYNIESGVTSWDPPGAAVPAEKSARELQMEKVMERQKIQDADKMKRGALALESNRPAVVLGVLFIATPIVALAIGYFAGVIPNPFEVRYTTRRREKKRQVATAEIDLCNCDLSLSLSACQPVFALALCHTLCVYACEWSACIKTFTLCLSYLQCLKANNICIQQKSGWDQ